MNGQGWCGVNARTGPILILLLGRFQRLEQPEGDQGEHEHPRHGNQALVGRAVNRARRHGHIQKNQQQREKASREDFRQDGVDRQPARRRARYEVRRDRRQWARRLEFRRNSPHPRLHLDHLVLLRHFLLR